MKKLLISSCLLGACTKYDGGHNRNENLLKKLVNIGVISLCPEVLGGLSTPRPPAESTFKGKKVLGCGVTAALLLENNIKVFSEEDDIYEV